jgi:hypothetical protein
MSVLSPPKKKKKKNNPRTKSIKKDSKKTNSTLFQVLSIFTDTLKSYKAFATFPGKWPS